MNKAIFLDRDGVINKLPPKFPNDGIGDIRNYVTNPKDFKFLPGVFEAFRLIRQFDYLAVVVSNQGGAIGRKLVGEETIRKVFSSMAADICHEGGNGTFYYCIHRWDECCSCVKPKPGMLYAAAYDHNICLEDSWMIGDSLADIYAGYNAGIAAERLINVGNGDMQDLPDKWFYKWTRHNVPYICRDNLLEAVKHILKTRASGEE